jgi:hypothetical protein
MNHQKIYNNIIETAKKQNRIKLNKTDNDYIYYEKHHILPKCLNGSEEKENKILLTAKEHYICHKLLTYIFKENRKIVNAFHRMTFDKRGRHNISSRDYAYARELKSNTPISEESKEKNRQTHLKNPFYEEKKQKQKENNFGENNPMYGRKQSKEMIEKRKKTCEERFGVNCSLNFRKINKIK